MTRLGVFVATQLKNMSKRVHLPKGSIGNPVHESLIIDHPSCFKFTHLTAGKWHVIIMSYPTSIQTSLMSVITLVARCQCNTIMLTLAYLQRRLPNRNVHNSQPTSSRAAFLPHEDLAWRCFVLPRVVERDGRGRVVVTIRNPLVNFDNFKADSGRHLAKKMKSPN